MYQHVLVCIYACACASQSHVMQVCVGRCRMAGVFLNSRESGRLFAANSPAQQQPWMMLLSRHSAASICRLILPDGHSALQSLCLFLVLGFVLLFMIMTLLVLAAIYF